MIGASNSSPGFAVTASEASTMEPADCDSLPGGPPERPPLSTRSRLRRNAKTVAKKFPTSTFTSAASSFSGVLATPAFSLLYRHLLVLLLLATPAFPLCPAQAFYRRHSSFFSSPSPPLSPRAYIITAQPLSPPLPSLTTPRTW
ncbi:hypothetical protein ACHAWF_002452 [Thalassiosira exigua]